MSEQANPQAKPQPELSTSDAVDAAAAALTEAPPPITPAPLTSSSNSAPASKIPLRPRKIQKLSPDDPKPSTLNPSTSAQKPSSASKNRAAARRSSSEALARIIPRVTARSLSCEGEVESALSHLRAADPLLSPLIDLHPPPTFDTFHTPFLALTKSILYQQLAYKAGTSIYTRFVSLCGGEHGVVPEAVLALNPHQLRQIGISGRKASYLHDLARKYRNGILSDSSIVNMDDKSLFTMLTMVNGIGSWSVHMFMIFSLHRPDVLPINDLGVRKGVQMLYGLEELPRPSQMEQLCDKWRPYRSVASWYMWRFVEAKGAPSGAASSVASSGASLHHQHQHQQPPPPPVEDQQPLVDPINSILNLGYNEFHFSS
ncbi:probable DNA-3-methyladenine glycosylase 2 [Punica granatum]|uniref:HhH-GPD domain-containing protein n=2 Tax=Punica granatum TaxID=22663 RepID=A0A218WQI2_PUNGR|nr:probable DNA-3-methyladenine glycosylase 2 [Punica granatum]OWM75065.1 hypothetical protein CDL15_Pgr021416 [Punica granatum]PKI45148.1 hypothetical protein CRG98_034452 [Punica granatum]